ncbi:uncharacterized protein CC84DRAFT_521825 [Paraphaeosphaeria sporulosa]|uniref:Zn(2)-C6 fungal-type domain-containing protein n=1 Tax=Paraphaeosphaeria sporulosa TaxID=1460663 RepID=A0A177CK12_9PLEO|nr:uncharacterized protein CC84DRAFT_521825 [Paraphaeosphaeria sporulosa]OAG07855.1 hypothetical protein CC84DRAFT_521825 [Paraphaeosphaeria sporulosa]
MKSYDGCWTCRLRKKRCDEIRPVCRNCSTLQITCHFEEEKPLWMDGGLGQKEKAEEIKREVKSAAARRRGVLSFDVLEPITVEPSLDSSTRTISPPTLFSTDSTPSNGYVEPWSKLEGWSASDPPKREPTESELDRRFVMFYFDHFFPFLFPFYKPSLLEGGRTWVMELVQSDQVMWHTTLAFSSYFVSVTLDGAVSGHSVCKTLAWEKLLRQMGVTFATLKCNLQEAASANIQDVMVRTVRTMGSIIQLQRLEIAVGNFENCRKHLGAANSLFRRIMDGSELLNFCAVLNVLGRPLWSIKSQERGAWNSDQAAFRFYSALLIVDDTVAGICTGEAPELLHYHAQLLTSDRSAEEKPPLSLEEFVGCENWVILQMGEIAALDAWKKAAKKAGRLDMMELVARASAIQRALLENLARLDAAVDTSQSGWLGLFRVYNDQLPPMPGGCAVFVTRVWAHAALLYLAVSVSGWQPGSVAIRENVTRILGLLERMSAPELLRTVVWPYCIVGCLCEPVEEVRVRAMAEALAPHRLFGTARKALEIMENVWKRRDELTVETDFATCIRSLGYVSLLV